MTITRQPLSRPEGVYWWGSSIGMVLGEHNETKTRKATGIAKVSAAQNHDMMGLPTLEAHFLLITWRWWTWGRKTKKKTPRCNMPPASLESRTSNFEMGIWLKVMLVLNKSNKGNEKKLLGMLNSSLRSQSCYCDKDSSAKVVSAPENQESKNEKNNQAGYAELLVKSQWWQHMMRTVLM